MLKSIIATGRPIPGVQTLLDELNLKESGDYVITFNGGLVQDTATGENIITETMTYDDYLDIEFLSRKLDVHMHAITKEGIFTANRNIGKYTVHESTLVNMPIFYRTPEEMGDKEIIKMMFIDEPEILDAAIAKIPQEFYDKYTIVKSTPFYLEFMNKTASKGNAITHLAEKWDLAKTKPWLLAMLKTTVPCLKPLVTLLSWKMVHQNSKKSLNILQNQMKKVALHTPLESGS